MKCLALVALLLAGCATTGPGPSMGCLDPVDPKCPDPTAYPPLTAQLPRWPFPRLEQEAPPPAPPSPGAKLIQKLTK